MRWDLVLMWAGFAVAAGGGVAAWVGGPGWVGPLGVAPAAALVLAGVRARDRRVSRRVSAGLARVCEAFEGLVDGPPEGTPPPPGLGIDEALSAWGAHARGCAGRVSSAVASLEAAYGELSTFLQVIDEPVLVCDERQVVILANAAASGMLELDSDALLGRVIDEVFTNAEVLSLHARASRGELGRRRVTLAGGNGNRVAEVSAVPVPVAGAEDGGRNGVLLVLRDVSELARALQIRTDFAANASHELRTPIASLRGAVDTLVGVGSGDEAMRERLLHMLDENVGRLEDLIRDLLDLSRLEAADGAVRLSLVPASELVRVLSSAFEQMGERGGISLRFEMAPELERLRTDRNLVTIILRNLIENAIKFSAKGDEVLVRGYVAPAGPGEAGHCVFEVIDHGQGIPLPMQQRIFERFYQADSSRDGSKLARGTGLGLAIVKHAVRSLGGTIRVKSIWQRGTTMTVELRSCVPACQDIHHDAPHDTAHDAPEAARPPAAGPQPNADADTPRA